MVEFRAGFLEDKQMVYEDMVALCLELGEPLRALEYAERAKSRALLDLLAYRLDLRVQARQPDDQQMVEALAELQGERNRRYRRLESRETTEEAHPSDEEQSQRQQILQLERQITDIWHRLLVRNADYAHDAALWQVRTEPILPHLEPGTVLLEYFVIKRQLVAFLATRDRVELRRLPCDLAQVQRLIDRLWLNFKSVHRQPSASQAALAANAQGLLGQLDRLLRAPLQDRLAAYPRLIVVPHGPLHYLPFHALYDGSSFAIERHEVSYLPGASILRYCRAAQSSGTASVAFGHSCGGRLPYAVAEARAIGGTLAGQVLVEDEASLAQFHELAAGARVLHLATHGDFRPDNPLFSGLALADGWLTTLSIFHLRLSASLVTLSACQTGRSVVGGGDELLGLMRAFLYAGAASLVVSLWTIEDRSAARLMQTFYARLAAGCSKAAALREAQLECIGRQADGAAAVPHPYFWASLFLVGDTGPL